MRAMDAMRRWFLHSHGVPRPVMIVYLIDCGRARAVELGGRAVPNQALRAMV